MVNRMHELGVHALFSSLTPENAERVYHHDCVKHVRVVSSLPGYVSQRLRSLDRIRLSEREFDIVYRGRPLPSWYGKCTQEKVSIGIHARRMAQNYGLRIDCEVDEESRVYGSRVDEIF